MGNIIFRIILVVSVSAAGYFLPPFHFSPYAGAGLGLILGLFFLFLEYRIRKSDFKIVWSTAAGTFLGLIVAWVAGLLYGIIAPDAVTTSFIRISLLIILPAVGFLIGSQRFEWFDPLQLVHFFKEKKVGGSVKILDTSVIIDGRIVEICDTGFIEGSLILPQFILKELQLVADSSDSVKRQRGRRGLDVLDRLQKSSQVTVVISELDFVEIKEVDSKLIELAKHLDAKIITNDFNLNKIAQLQGIPVLNINELANSLKPVVLPGESIRVFILKEGKEKDQGVAYLDDGTMVVVDNSRKMIGQNIDVTVTSVLQTTVGKMIFGRYNEDSP
ncbi:MAG: TRAM domain-containing protein [Candidatus Aminicenantes bacterium]|nr:TRAM domain-containing protein [Candidatus Aminicenantes bacterium]